MIINYIRATVPKDELLATLAEEASELAHAAMKLRRVGSKTNPTPVSESVATYKLMEEVADVLAIVEVLDLCGEGKVMANMVKSKLKRWFFRLREVERNG